MMPMDRYVAGYRSVVESLPNDEALAFIERMLCSESDKAARTYLKQTYLEMTEKETACQPHSA